MGFLLTIRFKVIGLLITPNWSLTIWNMTLTREVFHHTMMGRERLSTIMVYIFSASPHALTCFSELFILQGGSCLLWWKDMLHAFFSMEYMGAMEKNFSKWYVCTFHRENLPCFFFHESQLSAWLHSRIGEYLFFYLAEPHSSLNVEDLPLIILGYFSPLHIRLKMRNSFTQLKRFKCIVHFSN